MRKSSGRHRTLGHLFAPRQWSFDQFLDSLIGPQLRGLAPEDRERAARTTGTILVAAVLVTLHWAVLLVFMPNSPNISPHANQTFPVAIVLTYCLYRLSRTLYYRLAAFAVVATSLSMIVVSFALDPRPITAEFALSFLVVPIALSCILLSIRVTVAVMAISIAGIFVIGLFHVVAFDLLLAIAAFVLFGGMMILTAALLSERRHRLKLAIAEGLRHQDARFRSVFNSTSEAMALLTDGQISDANAALQTLFGRSLEQLIGAPCATIGLDWTAIVNRTYRTEITVPSTAADHTQASGGTDASAHADLTAAWRATTIPLEVKIDRLAAPDEASLVVVMRDQRARRAAVALQARQMQAEAANAAKTRFLAYMSHELRTPLTAIIGYTTVALEQGPASTPHFLERIHKNSVYLRELVEAVLDLAQIEAGRFEAKIAPTSPVAEIQKMLALHRDLADTKGLRLTLHGTTPADLALDARRLRQIVGNLLHNALKYTHQGGVDVSLQFHQDAAQPTGELRIAVTDTGAGFTLADRELLFQPYFQDTQKTLLAGQTGVGLGLTLSQAIARSQGGDLQLTESHPGRGSRFTLVLPTHRLVAAHPAALSDAPAATQPQRSLVGIRALVAEDNDDIRLFLEMMLQQSGIAVTSVASGRAAISHAASADFDVVLMDIQMADLDGIAATKALRSGGVATPIIALTGHVLNGVQQQCLDAGCNDYLSKPITKEALLQRIRQNLPPLEPLVTDRDANQ